jgi:hypothetical protein
MWIVGDAGSSVLICDGAVMDDVVVVVGFK